jgi:hypothetical protein
MQAVESGIIDAVGAGGCNTDQLLAKTSMKPEEGGRFLSLLVNMGVLERYDGRLFLSRFARTFLHQESELSQLHVLEFEKVLIDKWKGLGSVLSEGQGSNTFPLPDEEYAKRLALFQKAMGEAALVRSKELWEAVGPLPETGMIIDVGAGDGLIWRRFSIAIPAGGPWHAISRTCAPCALQVGPPMP